MSYNNEIKYKFKWIKIDVNNEHNNDYNNRKGLFNKQLQQQKN